MLFYAATFIACLILAGGIVCFYRISSGASKAIYNTITPLSETKHPADHVKGATAKKAGTATPERRGQKARQRPGKLARALAALPAAQTRWAWAGSGNQVGERHLHRSKAGHCSLYEDTKSKPKNIRSPNVGRPTREEKAQSFGNSYKVTRITPRPKKTNHKSGDKPWGW